MDHISAVNIIRGLPENVVLVCAREIAEFEAESALESVTEVPKSQSSVSSEDENSPEEVVVPIYKPVEVNQQREVRPEPVLNEEDDDIGNNLLLIYKQTSFTF